MISLVIGLLFGVILIVTSFSPDITNGGIKLAVALAGVSIMLKTYTIYTLGGGI